MEIDLRYLPKSLRLGSCSCLTYAPHSAPLSLVNPKHGTHLFKFMPADVYGGVENTKESAPADNLLVSQNEGPLIQTPKYCYPD